MLAVCEMLSRGTDAELCTCRYAAALTLEKKWGTGDYMLSHAQRARAVEQHWSVNTTVIKLAAPPEPPGTVSRSVLVATILDNLARRLPMKLQIANLARTHYHHVVIDGTWVYKFIWRLQPKRAFNSQAVRVLWT